MSEPLFGKVVAIIAHGRPLDRAIAVCLAEAGASIAIATEDPVREQEFGTASIANEVWAIGSEQFSYVLDAASATAVSAFGAEALARLGGGDALIVIEPKSSLAVHGELLPAFVRGLGREPALAVVGPAGSGETTVPVAGPNEAVAQAVLERIEGALNTRR